MPNGSRRNVPVGPSNTDAQGNCVSEGTHGMVEEAFNILIARHMGQRALTLPKGRLSEFGMETVCCLIAQTSAPEADGDAAPDDEYGVTLATVTSEGFAWPGRA
ncbi:MAG: hypothetical protein Q9225_002869 [Loekoesia sp. 1 TL-2023]